MWNGVTDVERVDGCAGLTGVAVFLMKDNIEPAEGVRG